MKFNEFYEQIVLPAKKINPHHIRLDGEIAGGNRKIFGSFTHNNRIWKVHSDTHYEPLMLAYEYSCLDCEKNDPFIMETTRNGSNCLALIDKLFRLQINSKYKYLYIYEQKAKKI